MLLGDFDASNLRRSYDGMSDELANVAGFENLLVLVYFIGTTFVSQITILNMLIAIMSKTFDMHEAGLNENGKKQKLKLMAEYLTIVQIYRKYLCCCFQKKNQSKQNSFLFIITPSITEEDDPEDQDEQQR